MISIYISYDEIKKWFSVKPEDLNSSWVRENIKTGNFWHYLHIQVFNQDGDLVLDDRMNEELYIAHYATLGAVADRIKSFL